MRPTPDGSWHTTRSRSASSGRGEPNSLTEPAVADLQAVAVFIARDSAAYAAATVERILRTVDRLASFPRSGRVVPEGRKASVREVLFGAYRIIYRVRGNTVEVLAVIHAARAIGRMKHKPWKLR